MVKLFPPFSCVKLTSLKLVTDLVMYGSTRFHNLKKNEIGTERGIVSKRLQHWAMKLSVGYNRRRILRRNECGACKTIKQTGNRSQSYTNIQSIIQTHHRPMARYHEPARRQIACGLTAECLQIGLEIKRRRKMSRICWSQCSCHNDQ
jgi:hypothetical protein